MEDRFLKKIVDGQKHKSELMEDLTEGTEKRHKLPGLHEVYKN